MPIYKNVAYSAPIPVVDLNGVPAAASNITSVAMWHDGVGPVAPSTPLDTTHGDCAWQPLTEEEMDYTTIVLMATCGTGFVAFPVTIVTEADYTQTLAEALLTLTGVNFAPLALLTTGVPVDLTTHHGYSYDPETLGRTFQFFRAYCAGSIFVDEGANTETIQDVDGITDVTVRNLSPTSGPYTSAVRTVPE